MSKKYIEKEAAKQIVKDYLKRIAENAELPDALSDVAWNAAIETAYTAVSRVPPADVKPVVRGEWKEPEGSECVSAFTDDFSINLPSKKCSVCGHIAVTFPRANFCPNCGADMTPMPEGGAEE